MGGQSHCEGLPQSMESGLAGSIRRVLRLTAKRTARPYIDYGSRRAPFNKVLSEGPGEIGCTQEIDSNHVLENGSPLRIRGLSNDVAVQSRRCGRGIAHEHVKRAKLRNCCRDDLLCLIRIADITGNEDVPTAGKGTKCLLAANLVRGVMHSNPVTRFGKSACRGGTDSI